MDEPPSPDLLANLSQTSFWVFIVAIALLRLLNNLLKAGFFNLGQISQMSLAEKSRETETRLTDYLNSHQRLTFTAQLLDKVSLLCLLSVVVYFTKIESIIAFFLSFLIYLVIFDLFIPNAIGAYFPEFLVTRLFPCLYVFYAMCGPIVIVMITIQNHAKQRENASDEEDDPEDIKAFLRAGTQEGIIEEKEQALLHNLLLFSDTVVREVMTPRTDMICVERGQTSEEILDLFKKTKFSRLPVYNGTIDQIEGILRFKDLIEQMDEHNDITGYLKQTQFVPEGKNIQDLLQEMLKKRMAMVVVIDEFGGTAGLITLEDLIEEIVGEIHDEHEMPELDEIISLDNGDYLVDGKVPLEDFCQLFPTEVRGVDVDTVGGYIFNKKGRIPQEGEHSKIGTIPVEIVKADTRRIYQIRVPQITSAVPVVSD